jgi:hypothetical protein
MTNTIKEFDSDESRLLTVNPFLINSDIIFIILMIVDQLLQRIIDFVLSNRKSRSKVRFIGFRSPSPYNFDNA